MRKDTVSEEDEDDEVERIVHAAASDATLRPNGVIHHLVPVLASQDLKQQHAMKDFHFHASAETLSYYVPGDN